MQPHATPNGRASPYRGDPSPKPRVRSPARATKPWVRQPSMQRSPTGATLPNPESQPPHKPQRLRKPQRGDPSQSPGCAALQGRPNPGNTNRHTSPNHRTPPRQPQPPTAAQAPAGRPFSKPRVRSPARATKPWVSSYPQSRSPTGATLKQPWCTSWRLLWGRRPFALGHRHQCSAPTPPESVTRRSVGAIRMTASHERGDLLRELRQSAYQVAGASDSSLSSYPGATSSIPPEIEK